MHTVHGHLHTAVAKGSQKGEALRGRPERLLIALGLSAVLPPMHPHRMPAHLLPVLLLLPPLPSGLMRCLMCQPRAAVQTRRQLLVLQGGFLLLPCPSARSPLACNCQQLPSVQLAPDFFLRLLRLPLPLRGCAAAG